MADNQKNDFTLEDILAEQRAKKETSQPPAGARPATGALPATESQQANGAQPKAGAGRVSGGKATPEAPAHPAGGPIRPGPPRPATGTRPATGALPATEARQTAPKPANPQQALRSSEDDMSDTEDLNLYATGNIKAADLDGGKTKKGGFFSRFGKNKKKKVPNYDESEDMFYGIQLKPIDEYRKGYDPAGDISPVPDTYADLFDQSKEEIDDDVAANFRKLQEERRSRVEQAMQASGKDENELADELGIVAPMPVTSFAADPYARQHGVTVEGLNAKKDGLADFQRAQLASMEHDQTMQIKLNVLNDTVELESLRDAQPVSESSVQRILEAAPAGAPEDEQPARPAQPAERHAAQEHTENRPAYQERPAAPAQPAERPAAQEHTENRPAYQERPAAPAQPAERPAYREREIRPDQSVFDRASSSIAPSPADYQDIASHTGETGRPAAKSDKTPIAQKVVPPPTEKPFVVPTVKSPFEYREKGVPMHVLNTDLSQVMNFATPPEAPARSRFGKAARTAAPAPAENSSRNNPPEVRKAPPAAMSLVQEQPESIDDYTGPDDAKSIAKELRDDMHDLTLRMMITGAATVILMFVNLVFGHSLSADSAGSPVIYVALTLIFLMAAIIGCFRTVLNGLKALVSLNANSDSAIAAAAVGAVIQTISALFFPAALADGSLHLYAVILTAALFVNAAGKLTMIRRIHSNFRFVTSREQKYAVNLFDDHNTALKMTKDVVADKPVIAYQAKTGFLRRFLEISYRPDPSEISSQMLAPISLIASLVLCIVCMLITKSVPMAINSLTAALLVGVAMGNMLSINLPMSRLAKLARRAGAMVSGYEAVRLTGDVNAVMMDADDLFPKGTVVLDGIKTYAGRDTVEDSIIAASALMKKMGGPLSGVFEQVIMEKEDHLPDVSRCCYEDGYGVIGHVDGKTIYIGNRGLLISHKIEPPAREDEAPYAASNKQVIYLAQDSTVVALMVLTYTADRRRRNELHRMEDNGISVVIRTADPNVTPQFVGRLFGIDPLSVSVLDDALGGVYHELTARETPRSDATIATKGRIESLMTVLAACVASKRDANLIIALQNIGVVLGFLLVAFLSCFGAIGKLSAFTLFLFELLWLLLVMILPRMRKP